MIATAARAKKPWRTSYPVMLMVALLAGACGGGSTAGTGEQGIQASSGGAGAAGSPSAQGSANAQGTMNSLAGGPGTGSSTAPQTVQTPGNTNTGVSPVATQSNTGGAPNTTNSPNGDGGTGTAPAPNSGTSGGGTQPAPGVGGTAPAPAGTAPDGTSSAGTAPVPEPDAGSAEPEPLPMGNDATQLYKKYEDYFTIGAAIDSGSYRDAHATIWREHFNGSVCENEMKWDALEPTEGNFNFSQARAMVDAATGNNMKMRGHVLVWFDQTPDWVFQGTKDQVLGRMRNHITRVMQEFQGSVYAWDVVNEAVIGYDANNQDVGEELATLDHWGYRDSRWLQVAGEDYIFEAFRAARAADPSAKLFYNDFWNYLDGKREFILSFVKRLKDEGIIDGIGLQCHLNISPAQESMTNQTAWQTVENLEKENQEYAALGLDVHITELDISIYTRDYPSSDQSHWFTGNQLTDELQDKLATRYKEFFEMFRRNADKIQNVTFWGIADDDTWLSEFASGRPDHPLLFDKQLKPKKAFDAIMDF